MTSYAFYDTTDPTGKVLQISNSSGDEAVMLAMFYPGWGFVECDDNAHPDHYYVAGDPPALVAKATFDLSFDTLSPAAGSPATLTSTLPVGTVVTLVADTTTAAGIVEQVYTHAGGPFSFTSNLKAPHRLRFDLANYVTEEVTLDVV